LTICVGWWLIRNGHRFDVIVGWATYGIIAAILRGILRWHNTRVCLILYRLFDPDSSGLANQLKRFILRMASSGADSLLTLDSLQAVSFAQILGRKPGTTQALTYGVDTDWYDIQLRDIQQRVSPATIFCPGSAYRDDRTLENAIRDLDVQVERYQLDNSGTERLATEQVGKACLEKNYNAPYDRYMADCRNAAMVVIAVENADKPVGLTSLLECMVLGRPVIITKGASSRDYVRDGVTGLLYEEGNWEELREKIRFLLEYPEVAEQIGAAAREDVHRKFGLYPCGQRFYKHIHSMGTIK
jgi:hypothetical protein